MSKEKTLRTLEETEVMQATGIPTQEADGEGVVIASLSPSQGVPCSLYIFPYSVSLS